MGGPQDRRQIIGPQDHQVQGEGPAGGEAQGDAKARQDGIRSRSGRNSASPSAITAKRISRPTACAPTRIIADLGIADASHGLAQAHVIRLIGPCNPAEVSKLHFHDVEFQMVYVLKGWVKTYMEGQGETMMKEGSCLDPAAAHQASDHGLFRRRRIAGSDPAGGVQDGGIGVVGRCHSRSCERERSNPYSAKKVWIPGSSLVAPRNDEALHTRFVSGITSAIRHRPTHPMADRPRNATLWPRWSLT